MKRNFYIIFGFIVVIYFSVNCKDNHPFLKNGIWRTTLQRPDGQLIVFNFETKDSLGKKILYILNASERLLVDSIRIQGDSIFIQMPFFDSGFKAVIDKDGNLVGSWVKRLADRERMMPFKAVFNQQDRFAGGGAPRYNISGKWSVKFTSVSSGKVIRSLGDFNQNGSRLEGTFITSSGDYRYLEGIVAGDSLLLSGFNGEHAFMFTAKIENDNKISGGRKYSGFAGVEDWTADKDATAALPDGYDETRLRPGEDSLAFRFKSTEGRMVSLKDPIFKGKVVVVQIMGSWCPNCMDETRFLSDYYQKNKKKGVEIIALAYEISTDYERSVKSLRTFQKRFNVQYPVLITGVTATDSLKTEKTLPQIEKIKAFPTTIFIGRDGKVSRIYTGFTGPGSGIYYKEYIRDFDKTVTGLLN